jgi:putative NADH-flavin reductase
MRPIVVLMGLAALVVAACGSSSPTPSPSASAVSAPPQAVVSPAPSSGTTFTVKLPAVSGSTKVRVVVHDTDGVLALVRVSSSSESKAVSRASRGGNAALTGGKTAKLLVIGWVGSACDKKVDIAVQGTKVTVAPAPVAACRTVGIRRSVTLKFSNAIDSEAMTATFIAPAAQP